MTCKTTKDVFYNKISSYCDPTQFYITPLTIKFSLISGELHFAQNLFVIQVAIRRTELNISLLT